MSACFAEVVGGRFDGLGYVLAQDDGLCGIDLDHCIKEGVVEPWAMEIVEKVNSYTEISPGSDGLHIVAKVNVDFVGRKSDRVEIYNYKRYLTVTANHLPGTPETLNEATEAVEKLIADFPDRKELPGELLAVGASSITLDPDAEPPSSKLAALIHNSPKFADSWFHTRKDMRDDSLSSYDMSIATIAAYAEWSDQEIANLLISHRREAGSVEKSLRRDYVERTIALARDATRHEMRDEESAAIHHMEEAHRKDDGEALAELSSRLGLSINGVIQRGLDPAFYYLDTEHGEIHLGNAENVLSQAKVRAAVMIKTQLLITRVKTREWDRIVNLMNSIIQVEDLGEGERAAETEMWVLSYFTERPRQEPETRADLVQVLSRSDDSFIWEGAVYLRLAHLGKFLFNYHGVKVPSSVLGARLREIGWHPYHFQAWHESTKAQARTWTQTSVPAEPETAEGADTL